MISEDEHMALRSSKKHGTIDKINYTRSSTTNNSNNNFSTATQTENMKRKNPSTGCGTPENVLLGKHESKIMKAEIVSVTLNSVSDEIKPIKRCDTLYDNVTPIESRFDQRDRLPWSA